jgi:hypothetical protein
MKVEWLDRSIISGPYLCLVLSEAAFHEAFDDLEQDKTGRPDWITTAHANATAHTLLNKAGNLCAVVCLGPSEGRSGIEIAGLLLHEAVHIWQRFCQHIGEDEPSMEFEAYSIQWIAQQLMWSFQEQTR